MSNSAGQTKTTPRVSKCVMSRFLCTASAIALSFAMLACYSLKDTGESSHGYTNAGPDVPIADEGINIKLPPTSFERAMAEKSRDFHIPPLLGKRLNEDESELRVWTGNDESYDAVLLLERGKIQNRAYLLSRDLENWEERPGDGRVYPPVQRHELSSPVSGWTELDAFLAANGVQGSLPFASEPSRRPIIMDEGEIILEIRSGKAYDVVSFSEFTETVDGRTVVEICRRLAREFHASIRCSP